MGNNALCVPAQFCITIVFDLFWDECNTQEKLKKMVMQNLGGKEDALWSVVKMVNSEKHFRLRLLCSCYFSKPLIFSFGRNVHHQWANPLARRLARPLMIALRVVSLFHTNPWKKKNLFLFAKFARAYETWKQCQWIMRTLTCKHKIWAKIGYI